MTDPPAAGTAPTSGRPQRRAVLIRLDPAVHDSLTRWAADELRSVNAQVEIVLRRALADAGRAPTDARPIRRPGRPRRAASGPTDGPTSF